MERTKNYNLLKPGVDDFYDVDDFNKNADIVDEELKRVDNTKVPTTRKINGKALAGDITLSAADVGLGNISNELASHKNDWAKPLDAADKHWRTISIVGMDLNKIVSSGIYDGKELLNAPNNSIDWWYIEVITHSFVNAYCIQVAYGFDGMAFKRLKINGNWQPWCEIVTTSMISNKNLLLNWDFRNPVNQRGQSSYSGGGYTIDRWQIANGEGRVIVNDGYITVFGEGNHCWLCQPLESYAPLTDKKLTLSVMMKSGKILSCTDILGSGYIVLSHEVHCNFADDSVSVIPLNGNSFDIAAVKLELGPVSTLANDPPANYGEQLALCQRYYEQGQGAYAGQIGNISWAAGQLGFKATKRAIPTLQFKDKNSTNYDFSISIGVNREKRSANVYEVSIDGSILLFDDFSGYEKEYWTCDWIADAEIY